MALTLTQVAHERDADAALLVAQGAIDQAHAPILDRAFGALLEAGATNVVLDLASVRYVSSSGIATLVKAAQAFEARGGGLSLLGVGAKVRVVLEMLGVEPVFAVCCQERPRALVPA